jgi:hypothetical protein
MDIESLPTQDIDAAKKITDVELAELCAKILSQEKALEEAEKVTGRMKQIIWEMQEQLKQYLIILGRTSWETPDKRPVSIGEKLKIQMADDDSANDQFNDELQRRGIQLPMRIFAGTKQKHIREDFQAWIENGNDPNEYRHPGVERVYYEPFISIGKPKKEKVK